MFRAQHGLSLLPPVGGRAKQDLMASLTGTPWRCHGLKPDLSDHPVISLSIPVAASESIRAHLTTTMRRFFIRKLKSREVESRLIHEYHRLRWALDSALLQANDLLRSDTDCPSLLLPAAQATVDSVYGHWQHLIHSVAESALGSYSVSSQRQQPDTRQLHALQGAQLSTVDALLAFRRSQRGRQAHLASTNPALTPLEDCGRVWGDIWCHPSTDPQPDLSTLFESSDPPSWLSAAFDRSKIRRKIVRYPATKSCGSDAIHSRILQSLAPDAAFMDDIIDSSFFFFAWALRPLLGTTRWFALFRKGTRSSVPIRHDPSA